MRVASFHLARFRGRRSISKLLTVPAERWELTSAGGCFLGKVLGTSQTGTTRPGVDIARWAIFAVWDSERQRTAFVEESALMQRWLGACVSMEHFMLDPLASRGTWGGADPFGNEFTQEASGEVAVLTRASVRWNKIVAFTRAIPPVDDDLQRQDGCSLALGVGEWPMGQQATFSVWNSVDALQRFAYKGDAHADVIRRTYRERWYSEEMFSRFAITQRLKPVGLQES